MRIAVRHGGVEARRRRASRRCARPVRVALDAMDAQPLRQRRADAPPGVERGAGVLVHVLHGAARAACLRAARHRRRPRPPGGSSRCFRVAGPAACGPASSCRSRFRRRCRRSRRLQRRSPRHRPPAPPARRRSSPCRAPSSDHQLRRAEDLRQGSAPHGTGRRRRGPVRPACGGTASAQSGCAMGQRGWKRQPEGCAVAAGTVPGMPARSVARSGWQASSMRV